MENCAGNIWRRSGGQEGMGVDSTSRFAGYSYVGLQRNEWDFIKRVGL